MTQRGYTFFLDYPLSHRPQGGQPMTCETHDWRYVNTVGDTVHYECPRCGQMMSETEGSDYDPPVSVGEY